MTGLASRLAPNSMLVVAPGLVDTSGALAASADVLDEILSGLELPGCEDFINSAEVLPAAAPTADFESGLFALLGVAQGHGVDPPVGSALYFDEFGQVPPSTCFAAEPVFLEAGLRDVSLHRAATLALDEADADSFLESLEEHFREDGWGFCRGPSGRWYALGAEHLQVTTHSPMVAPNQRLEDLLPKGSGAPQLHQFLNEAQMLLHNHPVNRRRAACGQRPVNGIWLWGGGPLAEQYPCDWSAVISDLPLAEALARRGGAQSLSLPKSAGNLNIEQPKGRLLVIDDRALHLLSSGDLSRWREWLEIFDRSILGPAMRALRHKSIEQVVLDYGGDRLLCRRRSSWSWSWRRQRGKQRIANFLKGKVQ